MEDSRLLTNLEEKLFSNIEKNYKQIKEAIEEGSGNTCFHCNNLTQFLNDIDSSKKVSLDYISQFFYDQYDYRYTNAKKHFLKIRSANNWCASETVFCCPTCSSIWKEFVFDDWTYVLDNEGNETGEEEMETFYKFERSQNASDFLPHILTASLLDKTDYSLHSLEKEKNVFVYATIPYKFNQIVVESFDDNPHSEEPVLKTLPIPLNKKRFNSLSFSKDQALSLFPQKIEGSKELGLARILVDEEHLFLNRQFEGIDSLLDNSYFCVSGVHVKSIEFYDIIHDSWILFDSKNLPYVISCNNHYLSENNLPSLDISSSSNEINKKIFNKVTNFLKERGESLV